MSRMPFCRMWRPAPLVTPHPWHPIPENLLPVRSMAMELPSLVSLMAVRALPYAAVLLTNVQFVQEKAAR